MRHQPVWSAFGLDLLGSFAERQRLALGEDVGEQHVVMTAEWIERVVKRDEIARDEFRGLVNQLVERVLPVGPRLAPENRPGLIIDRRSVERDVLAVGLHRELLQIRRKAL